MRFYEILIKTSSKSSAASDVNQFTSLSSSIDFYITPTRSNLIIFKIIKLSRFLFTINVQIIKTFLNEDFESNKKTHIEEFKKDDSL